jgi:hypothetical protein
VALQDGQRLILRVGPLAGGAMAVRFLPPDEEAAPGPVRFTRAARSGSMTELQEVAEAQAPYQARDRATS